MATSPACPTSARPAWLESVRTDLAAAICFEDTLPQVFRRLFAEAPDGRHPDIVLNLSNDGWFHDTSEHEMHLAESVFPLSRIGSLWLAPSTRGSRR